MLGKNRLNLPQQIRSIGSDQKLTNYFFAIAKYMIGPGDSVEEWADSAFVSDESSIYDFLLEEDIEPFRKELGLLSLSGRDLIWVVAQRALNTKTKH